MISLTLVYTEPKYIIMNNISVKLHDIQLKGPVIHNEENDSYTFVNRHSSDDIYIEVKRDDQGNWYQSGGPSISFPKEFVDSVGNEIESIISK